MGNQTLFGSPPSLLEQAYRFMYATLRALQPLIERIGYARFSRWLLPVERSVKRALFGCQMCGQCALRSTGMVCPMSCPKNLRNGACGGVRLNGNCEVIPDMKCIWVVVYERAQQMRGFGPEMITVKPPMDHRLAGTSAWINMLTGQDENLPKGWADLDPDPVVGRRVPK